MKKFAFLTFLTTMIVFCIIAISSCTKEGPQGPAGTNGTNGVDGEDGIDGQDGTAGCITCHNNDQGMFAKTIQWEASTHANGGNFERNSTSCGSCHTSQGFLENMGTGTVAASVANPSI